MEKMKDFLKKEALKIIKGVRTEKEKVEKIWNFVKEEIKYKVTILADPERILKEKYGSCIDKTILFVFLLKNLGVKGRYHIVLFDVKSALNKIKEERPEIFKKFTLNTLFLKNSILEKIPPLPHSYPEAFINKKWIKFDRSFLDKDLEEKIKGGRFLSKEIIKIDLGTFYKASDILKREEIKRVISLGKKMDKLASLVLNKVNSYLLFLRNTKDEKLAKKENISEIIDRIIKFSKKDDKKN